MAQQAQNWDDFKGRVKEATGTLLDDSDMEQEGKADQIQGQIKEAIDDFTDRVRSFFDK